MKILVVSFEDDNFGDNLIRICFEKILASVLHNLKISDYVIRRMSLKRINEELIKDSDMVFFAGGGLLGLSYLNFFEFLERILEITEEHNIPVVFSSVGVNNMDSDDKDDRLRLLLDKKCIKAVSVRENVGFFRNYIENKEIEIREVCDPAVWTCFIYDEQIRKVEANAPKGLVGINVVRGGLFKDNKRNWKLSDEMKYLSELKEKLDEKNLDYRFYTNGSFLDNNTLRYFAKINEVPDEKIIYVHTTSELVRSIASFESVYAIRMHSSIISYSLGKPCLNLIWNDKVPLFYRNIGREDQAVALNEWQTDRLVEKMEQICVKDNKPDTEYMMSLYNYLFDIMNKLTASEECERYTFEEIREILKADTVSVEEDIRDYQVKLDKGEKKYLGRFIYIKDLDKEMKDLKKVIEKQKQQLERLNDLLVIKVGRKMKSFMRKTKETKVNE